MAKELNVKILHVTKTSEQWAAETTPISKGLLCVEFTTDGKTRVKVGDGVKTFAQLPYVSDGSFDISNYVTNEQVDTKVSDAVSALGTVLRIKGIVTDVKSLPTINNKPGDIYFVGTQGETADSFTEYVYTTNNKFEYLGKTQTEVDLSDYATLEYVDTQLQTLTDNSHTHSNKDILDSTTAAFTTEEKTKLEGIDEGANKTIVDTELSATSTNPVQNSVITAELNKKVNSADLADLVNDIVTPYDDTEVKERLSAIEADYITSTDDLVINCKL